MGKKINVFKNGVYMYSTNQYDRCKDAIAELIGKTSVHVASVPADKVYMLSNTDKITASFDKGA